MDSFNFAVNKFNENNTQDAVNSLKWFAVQAHTLKEHIAKINFENQGFKVYLPQVRTVRHHARRVENIKKAFFPGYLFLHLAPDEKHWHTIESTRGVIRAVRFGEHYPPVPDRVMEELYSREDENGLISFNEINSGKFKQGDKVKVSLISSSEQTGIFKGLHGNGRAMILLDILQREVAAIVPLSGLSPLNYC